METTIKKKIDFSPSPKTREFIFDVISFAFVILFVYTAASKIATINLFTFTLSELPVIGKMNYFVARAVPAVELLVSLLLIIPKTKRTGVFASLILMFVFTIWIVLMILFAPHLPCSCGGVIQAMGWKWHVVFNLGFIGLAAFALAIYKRQQT